MQRIVKELNDINSAKPSYIYSISAPDNLTWNLVIHCVDLQDSPFKNGFFHVNIKFPENYPFKQPEFIFSKPNQIFHPNVDEKGQICKDMIGEWKPTKKVIQIIEIIYNMFESPNLDTPINQKAGEMYKNNNNEFKKIAVDLVQKFASQP